METSGFVNTVATPWPPPTFDMLLELMEKAEKISKPEFTDVLSMRSIWEMACKELKAPTEVFSPPDRLPECFCGIPVFVFDDLAALFRKREELERKGRRPHVLKLKVPELEF